MNTHALRARHLMECRLVQALDGADFTFLTTPIRCGDSLRTCMELTLRKHLADHPRVYEIGTCFRNDPPDETHLPEFHMLELFWDRPSFAGLVKLTADLLEVAFQHPVSFEALDLAKELPLRYPGFEYGLSLEALKSLADRHLDGGKVASCRYAYEIYNALIDNLVDERRPGTRERPAMIINYPAETICLAKPQADHPTRIERAEFFVDGLEVAHGFADDMDARRVMRRMEMNGPDFVDRPFVDLLASGRLPPSSGVGFGLDRLAMIALGVSDIRDTVAEVAA